MARKVFFSFHYDMDVWRVAQVRNSNVINYNYDESQFLDHAEWESIQRSGDSSIRGWIDRQLEGSTITCVLIGSQTDSRKWVHYEIQRSIERKNAILGIYIHNIKNARGEIDFQGLNPLSKYKVGLYSLTTIASTYDWVYNRGYENFQIWIEEAVRNFKAINYYRGL